MQSIRHSSLPPAPSPHSPGRFLAFSLAHPSTPLYIRYIVTTVMNIGPTRCRIRYKPMNTGQPCAFKPQKSSKHWPFWVMLRQIQHYPFLPALFQNVGYKSVTNPRPIRYKTSPPIRPTFVVNFVATFVELWVGSELLQTSHTPGQGATMRSLLNGEIPPPPFPFQSESV